MISNDNTKHIIFVVLTIVILLFVLWPLLSARFEQEGIQPQNSKSLWLALKIVRFLSGCLVVLWLGLIFYYDWLRKKIENIDDAIRTKYVVSVLWWANIAILISLAFEFLIVLCRGSHRIVFSSIESILLIIAFSGFLLFSWDIFQHFRKNPLYKIVASCLREQSNKFLHAHDFDKAYATLTKASEIAPDETELWCRLAYFCELIRKNTAEADKFIAKAGESIATKKVVSNSDQACYLNYLGTILYERGECEKGLEYIKQSIAIGPNPGRINSYEKKLSEWKEKQKEPSSNTEQ